jgi:hypothetical protein
MSNKKKKIKSDGNYSGNITEKTDSNPKRNVGKILYILFFTAIIFIIFYFSCVPNTTTIRRVEDIRVDSVTDKLSIYTIDKNGQEVEIASIKGPCSNWINNSSSVIV